MIETTTDCQKLRDWRAKLAYCHFRLLVVVAVARGQFLCSGRGRKPQVCRRNCSDICHTVGDISTSGFDGHVAISGYPSMSHLFVDIFFEFGEVDNFLYCARITVILQIYSAVWVCDWLCSRWRSITTSGFVRHLENVQIPLFTLTLPFSVPFSVSNIPKIPHLWSLSLSFTGVQCW